MVNRLPPKQKAIKNFFFDSEISAMAPRTGAVINTKRAVVPERNDHRVVALVDISIPQSLKTHPSEGTITVAKYMGKRAAITVVANAEFAQSYIYHAKTFLFLSLFTDTVSNRKSRYYQSKKISNEVILFLRLFMYNSFLNNI